jgi:hypothetical protein
VKGTQRETRQKRQIKKRRGRREDEFIPLKARYNAAIQSEVSATQSEKTDETDEKMIRRESREDETDIYKEKEREERRRIYTVEIPL